jgi:hypothetical protein
MSSSSSLEEENVPTKGLELARVSVEIVLAFATLRATNA